MGPLYCSACGHRLGAGDHFCTACGGRIAPSESDPTATAVRRPVVAAHPPTRRPRRARARRLWWVLGALAAVFVAGVSYALGTLEAPNADSPAAVSPPSPAPAGSQARHVPSVSPTADPQALAQARALRRLIVHSAADKHAIAGAAAQLAGCRHVAEGVATFAEAARSRDRLVDQAAELQVGLLPGGGAAIASLSQALRAAAAADRAYVAWGQVRHRVDHQCRGGKQLRLAAVQLSSASHAPKHRAAQAWNVIAAQLGLPRISWTIL